MMATRLQRDIHGGALRSFTSDLQRANLRMRSTGRSCQPSPTTSPSRTMTQPTRGLGVVVYSPRSARRSARAMKRWSLEENMF